MTIEDLEERVTIPASLRPLDVDKWEANQSSLGIRLPSIWGELSRRLGSGTFVFSPIAEIWIYNAASSGFVSRVQKVCDAERETIVFHGEPFELPVFFPDVEGYFPVGEDRSNNTYWYERRGEPDGWPLVVWGRFGTGRVNRFNLDLVAFLVRLIENAIVVPGYEDGPHAVAFSPFPNGEVLGLDQRFG